MAMAMAKAKFAAPPRAGKVDDGARTLLRFAGSATLPDRYPIGTLDAPPGAVTIAALSDLIEEIGPLDAPPGAVTIDTSSGSLLRTSGSGSSASIGTPCASAQALLAYNLKAGYNLKADCAPLHCGVRALIAMLHLS
jgi:hypothetical protein